MITSKRYALTFAAIYFTFTTVYIEVSTNIVARIAAGDADRLKSLQKYKALGFMTLMSIALYFSIRWVSKKIEAQSSVLRETQERWMEAERKAAPALLASCIAHDVTNMLTVIRLNVESLKRKSELSVSSADSLARLDRGTDRLTELVKRLRGASSSLFHEPPQKLNFSRAVKETIELMSTHVCCQNVTVEVTADPDVQLLGYSILVHQMVMNLLINAAEATDRKGRVRFTVKRSINGASLSVEDNGPGIAPTLREKVLDAFVTTKPGGSGLGLSSVRSCVEIHDGGLEISDSEDLGGAKFTIWLPDLSADRVETLREPAKPVLFSSASSDANESRTLVSSP